MNSAAITIRLVIGKGARVHAQRVRMPRGDATKQSLWRRKWNTYTESSVRVAILQDPTVYRLLERDDKSCRWIVLSSGGWSASTSLLPRQLTKQSNQDPGVGSGGGASATAITSRDEQQTPAVLESTRTSPHARAQSQEKCRRCACLQ
jgi:hypothetical protein